MVKKRGQDGAAIVLAMVPALAADKEFGDNLDAFMSEYQGSFSDLKKATDLLAILWIFLWTSGRGHRC